MGIYGLTNSLYYPEGSRKEGGGGDLREGSGEVASLGAGNGW